MSDSRTVSVKNVRISRELTATVRFTNSKNGSYYASCRAGNDFPKLRIASCIHPRSGDVVFGVFMPGEKVPCMRRASPDKAFASAVRKFWR